MTSTTWYAAPVVSIEFDVEGGDERRGRGVLTDIELDFPWCRGGRSLCCLFLRNTLCIGSSHCDVDGGIYVKNRSMLGRKSTSQTRDDVGRDK
jgi:hypothetical protein